MENKEKKKGLSKKTKIILGITIPIVIIVLLLIFGFMFLHHPGSVSKDKKEQLKEFTNVKYIAHRGLFDKDPIKNNPENSLPAFKKAIDNGYGIELDVHLTTDNKLVVIHDVNLLDNAFKLPNENEMTEKQKELKSLFDKKVYEMTHEELINIYENFSLYGTNNIIPTLEDVFTLIKNNLPSGKKQLLLIEIKAGSSNTKEYINSLAKEISNCVKNNKEDNIITAVQSFHPGVLGWFKKNDKTILRGFLAKNYSKNYNEGDPKGVTGFMLQNLYTNFMSRPDFISYECVNGVSDATGFKTFKTFYPKIKRFAWTIKSKEQEELAIKKGYHAIIFDSYNPN